MATARKKPADLTGRQIEEANKVRDEEAAERAKSLTMATAAKKEAVKNEVVDLTDPKDPVVEPDEPIDLTKEGEGSKGDDAGSSDVAVQEIEVAEKFVTIRVNEQVDMTYAGVSYNLEVGPKYKLPKHIVDWLEEKGVVWH